MKNNTIKNHWKQLRKMTFDLLDSVSKSDLNLKLNFEESQTLRYQFLCILGTQESSISLIEKDIWEGWNCSLSNNWENAKKPQIKNHLKKADEKLLRFLDNKNLFEKNKNALMNYMILVEHESHHQGQMINFIYAHDLKIPDSWKNKWQLNK